MEALIKIAVVFTAVSLLTMVIYLRQKEPRQRLGLDITSLLVYTLVAGFFVASFLLFFLNL